MKQPLKLTLSKHNLFLVIINCYVWWEVLRVRFIFALVVLTFQKHKEVPSAHPTRRGFERALGALTNGTLHSCGVEGAKISPFVSDYFWHWFNFLTWEDEEPFSLFLIGWVEITIFLSFVIRLVKRFWESFSQKSRTWFYGKQPSCDALRNPASLCSLRRGQNSVLTFDRKLWPWKLRA